MRRGDHFEEPVHRRVYRLHSRNLSLGAYNEETRGFIGVREKFTSHFLFTEYRYDDDHGFATATALERVGEVPDDIELRESLGSECRCGCREIFYVRFHPPGIAANEYVEYGTGERRVHHIPGTWVCLGCNDPLSYSRGNSRLLEYLERLERDLAQGGTNE